MCGAMRHYWHKEYMGVKGVGPREVFDMTKENAIYTLCIGPIISFSGAKRHVWQGESDITSQDPGGICSLCSL